MSGWKHGGRHAAREAALQILYQWEIGGAGLDDTLAAYWDVREQDPGDGAHADPVDREYAARLARGTAASLDEIDPLIEAQAQHWRLARMAVIDRLILRLATYELRHESGAQPAVVINEALELARTYSSDDAVPFVNGILDAIARRSNGVHHEGRDDRAGREGEGREGEGRDAHGKGDR